MKFASVYVEEQVRDTPRTRAILDRLPDVPVIPIDRFGEVFNRKAQNFRLQKSNPALILAAKQGRLVLPAPVGYGFNRAPAFYFSHMLNCVYDCRYCFLQGMFRSANYVLFVNFEDFMEQVRVAGESCRAPVFYSGYDCDSLALEPVSGFIRYFVNEFSNQPDSTLEIRTKSTQVRDLYQLKPIGNCVIAMSFSPSRAHQQWESRVPSIEKRVDALARLQDQGWPVALRFEPLIYTPDYLAQYEDLCSRIFSRLDAGRLHSVSTGQFRMPESYFERIVKLYPDEPLYARDYERRDGMMKQSCDREQALLAGVENLLFHHIEKRQYYRCAQSD